MTEGAIESPRCKTARDSSLFCEQGKSGRRRTPCKPVVELISSPAVALQPMYELCTLSACHARKASIPRGCTEAERQHSLCSTRLPENGMMGYTQLKVTLGDDHGRFLKM